MEVTGQGGEEVRCHLYNEVTRYKGEGKTGFLLWIRCKIGLLFYSPVDKKHEKDAN